MFYICCVNTEHLHCLARLICVFIKGANDNWYSTVIFKMQIQLCLWQTRSHPQGRGAARKLMSCTQACEYTSTWPPLHQYRSPHVMQPDKKIKMVATRHISLSRTIPKCFCGRLSSAPDPIEEPYSALQISLLDLAATSCWRGEGEVQKERRGEETGGYGREWKRDWSQEGSVGFAPRNAVALRHCWLAQSSQRTEPNRNLHCSSVLGSILISKYGTTQYASHYDRNSTVNAYIWRT